MCTELHTVTYISNMWIWIVCTVVYVIVHMYVFMYNDMVDNLHGVILSQFDAVCIMIFYSSTVDKMRGMSGIWFLMDKTVRIR